MSQCDKYPQRHIFSRIEARGQGHSDPKAVLDTTQPQDVPTHQIILEICSGSIILEMRPGVKVTMTRKKYATFQDPKLYPHSVFGIPTSNNIGNILVTQKSLDGRTDGCTDGRTDRQFKS